MDSSVWSDLVIGLIRLIGLISLIISISLISQIRLIGPIRLISPISPIGQIAYCFVVIFHILVFNSCSFGFEKTPN